MSNTERNKNHIQINKNKMTLINANSKDFNLHSHYITFNPQRLGIINSVNDKNHKQQWNKNAKDQLQCHSKTTVTLKFKLCNCIQSVIQSRYLSIDQARLPGEQQAYGRGKPRQLDFQPR